MEQSKSCSWYIYLNKIKISDFSTVSVFFQKLIYIIRSYYFILYIVVSASPLLGPFPSYRFPVQSLLFTQKSLLYTPKPRANLVPTCGIVRCAQMEGDEGVPWVVWRRPWTRPCF